MRATWSTPALGTGYNHDNPLRLESAAEALEIDDGIARAWSGHPRRFVVDAAQDFLAKAARALQVLRKELPECCCHHHVAGLDVLAGKQVPIVSTPSR